MALDRLKRLSAYVPFVEQHYTKNLTILRTFVVEAKITGLDQRPEININFPSQADWAGHNLCEDCIGFLDVCHLPSSQVPGRFNRFERADALVRRIVHWRDAKTNQGPD